MKVAYVLPEKKLTNADLAASYEGWTEEKIFSKTGIHSRHISDNDETATDLAIRAAKQLFQDYQINPEIVDFILFCTQSPDYKLPTAACRIQYELGIPTTTGAVDFNLGCSGYVYGLSLAKGLITSGSAKNVLLLTGETYTKYIHPQDKSSRTIFGDGASATLIDEISARQIGDFSFGTDGAGANHLIVPTGGARKPILPDAENITDKSGNVRTENNLFMDGVEIFSFTLEIVPPMLKDVLAKNSLAKEDIDLFVFHQANKFMLDSLRKSNGIPRAKFYVNMEDVGNTVSSSIPVALARAEAEGMLFPGMRVMLVGFGVGLSWGATILTW